MTFVGLSTWIGELVSAEVLSLLGGDVDSFVGSDSPLLESASVDTAFRRTTLGQSTSLSESDSR